MDTLNPGDPARVIVDGRLCTVTVIEVYTDLLATGDRWYLSREWQLTPSRPWLTTRRVWVSHEDLATGVT